MKKLLALVLALILALSLCACGGSEAPVETTTEATTEAPTTEAPTTTEEVILYAHPLTGVLSEELWTGGATAVSLNNHKQAMPQYGVNQADIVYEFECEGGITRRLGIFSDLSKVQTVGPVRSARTYFSNVAVTYKAPLFHCGGSTYASRGQYDSSGDTIANWQHVDEFSNGGYFFRDKDRYNYQGYAWEHCLFTTGEKMAAAVEARGYSVVNPEGSDYGLTFAEVPTWTGDKAEVINITFRGKKTTTANYNFATGKYEISQYGSVGVDGNTGDVFATRNVLILNADQSKIGEHSFYDLIGSGTGYLACNGKVTPITWHREVFRTNFTYTLADGTPADLGIGTSYIAVIEGSVTFE